ncbi:MAG: FTR1 family protein [Bowdeniella nasicola]|nr:FTR1 family protein [Bowdeniella nasicola]
MGASLRLERPSNPTYFAKRFALLVAMAVAGLLLLIPASNATARELGKWGELADDIIVTLETAGDKSDAGDVDEAKALVKKARYELFAGQGLEEAIGSQLSGADANRITMDFGLLSQAIGDQKSDDVHKYIESLTEKIGADAEALDTGGKPSAGDLVLSDGKWGQTAAAMIELLDQGLETYQNGDAQGAKDLVNEAYYGHYEISGFEKMTLGRISGGRVAAIELEFALIKKDMTEGNDASVEQRITELKPKLIEDANQLDGFDGTGEGGNTGSSAFTIFIASLSVILREGIEAMLVVAAVIAYLVKAGHKDKTKVVWAGAVAALVVSVILAVAITKLTGLAGKNQELIEGITALVAVAMLVYVSNWMLGKSDAAAWDKFIKDKTDTSLSRGSLFSLAFVAFLAVVREGAETILFFQPILAMAADDTHMVWFGLGLGVALLVVVYLLIRLLSIRIPLRPFFLVTSVLLAIMALTFTGSGIRELQEADVVSVTPIAGLPNIDLLGFYPRVENLTAQAVVLVVMIGLFVYANRKNKRRVTAHQ